MAGRISRCVSSCGNCRNEQHVRLPLPARHERASGQTPTAPHPSVSLSARGTGGERACFSRRWPSSPQPFPPAPGGEGVGTRQSRRHELSQRLIWPMCGGDEVEIRSRQQIKVASSRGDFGQGQGGSEAHIPGICNERATQSLGKRPSEVATLIC